MNNNNNYKAFISYSHTDRKSANWLHRALEHYRIPKHMVGHSTPTGKIPSRLTPIFLDRAELASSPDLSDSIQEALGRSENLVVICSPASAQSRWVNQEVEVFKKLGHSDRIFCLIVDGEPTAQGTARNCFPPALRIRYDAEGNPTSDQAEPIAADMRKIADGKSLARLKIIAGLLGTGLDALRQRDLQRTQRRMAVIIASSLTALLFTSVLAINALLARNEANQRRAQAEDLLSFMVGDLRDSLQPIGRLDLLEKVGDKAMDYFSTINVSDLTQTELSGQAKVIMQLGEIRMDQQQYDTALASFMEAYERNDALYLNDVQNGDHLFNRGQTEFWVGYVNWRQGELEEARSWLTQYLNSSMQLTSFDPSRDDWAIEVAYGLHNLAVLALEHGNIEDASAGFSRELDTLLDLQRRYQSLDLKRDISDAVSWLGNIAVSQGEMTQAMDYYQRSAVVLKAISLEEPNNKSRQYNWAHAALRIVKIASITGDLDQANELVEEAMILLDKLAAHDENNMEWLRTSLKSHIFKANLLAAKGNWIESRALADQTIEQLEAMISSGTSDLNVRNHLADAYSLLTWINKAEGKIADALEASQHALDNLRAIEVTDTPKDEWIGRITAIYAARGQLQATASETEAAHQSLQQAISLLQDRVSDARSPEILDPWVRALILTDQPDEARSIRNRLHSRGYKPLQPWPL